MPRTQEKIINRNSGRADAFKKSEKGRDVLVLRGLSKRRLADGAWVVGHEAALADGVHGMVDGAKPR